MDPDVQDRSTEAVALIDAWLSEHAWWVDGRAIDFALDVRAVLSDSPQARDAEAADDADESLAPVAAGN
ncbi:MAG: hypothetical protein BMS9Abin07_0267 [Acidimicrobiia bacterium]|nr:MAG: hypothetical protein BMS9Abin07_0267 [Acidimicrobiia bacterium]